MSFEAGFYLSKAARASVDGGVSRDEFLSVAATIYDACANGYSAEVTMEALLGCVPEDQREEVREGLRRMGMS